MPDEDAVPLCCRFSRWDQSKQPVEAEVCPCGHRITPGYRCHHCGSTRAHRAAHIGSYAPPK